MNWKAICAVLFLSCWQTLAFASSDLASLKKDQKIAEFRVDHLYRDSEGKIVGAKFVHVPTGAPVLNNRPASSKAIRSKSQSQERTLKILGSAPCPCIEVS